MKEQMMKQSGNMVEFNDWVRQQGSQLHAHGEEATDLLAFLWHSYLKTPNKEFGDYIKSLCNEYEDSQGSYTAEQLMIMAEQKYKGRVLSGEWGSPSEKQVGIAKIDVLKQELISKRTEEQKNKTGIIKISLPKTQNGAGRRRSPQTTRH